MPPTPEPSARIGLRAVYGLPLWVRHVRHDGVSTATLSTKGQLVIPSRFRHALHLQPGDKVAFALEGEKLVIERAKSTRARLITNHEGRKVLVADADAPPTTSETVKTILADFP